ncbi:MAG: NAD-dependent succinate-semialdehyde dehydrogenase [Enterococcus sp.]
MTHLPNVPTKLFINGEWLSGGNPPLAIYNPATNEELLTISQGGANEAQQAITAANEAFPIWSALSPKERAEYLFTIADLMEEELENLAKIMTLEQGKPLVESTAEIQTAIENFRWNAAEGQRIYGEIIPSAPANHWLAVKQPVGVVAAITPWNFPTNMIARKIAPALAVGCSVILKPSKKTPLSALALSSIFERAQLPKGVFNLLLGNSKEIGEQLTKSNAVHKLTFTGSTDVGRLLYEQSATTIKKVSLELGGHAPFIVFSDADIPLAVDSLLSAKFRNNGQVCTAPNRIFVHHQVKTAFTNLLVERISDVSVGNGLDNPTIGPLIDEDGLKKIQYQVQDAKEHGAKILYGGKRLTGDTYQDGFFFEPTIIDLVDQHMKVFYQETFGPVIPIIEFSSTEQVISLANDTEFGLASYFFSNNLETISTISQKLDYGMVGVNEMAISNAAIPFGGVKHSGFGRENGHYGVEEYVDTKLIAIKVN